MSVSLWYLSHAKKEIQNLHELVHAHRLSVAIAIRVHKAITVRIKKAKDFQRSESRERLIVREFFKITDDYLLGKLFQL